MLGLNEMQGDPERRAFFALLGSDCLFAFSAASSPVQKQQKEELFENEPTKFCGHKDMQKDTVF